MGGGLIQLVAYGSQNVYLNCNPEITFFKVVYRKHTNFSIESIKQDFTGSLSNGQKAVCTINRSGDLLSKMHLEFNPKLILQSGTNNGWSASNIGHTLFKRIDLDIGGQVIDRHYGHWLSTNIALNGINPSKKSVSYTVNTGAEPSRGNSTLYNYMTYNHLKVNHGSGATDFFANAPDKAIVPLQFWFCRNIGLALPLISLQYHEVKLHLELCEKKDLFERIETGTISTGDIKLWCDYIFLDKDERRSFRQDAHEYLIDQVQTMNTKAKSKINLIFNHPVKEILWVPQSDWIYGTAKLTFNGTDRFFEQEEEYFQLRQPYQYHTSTPSQNLPASSIESGLTITLTSLPA